MNAAAELDVYVTTVFVDEVFADPTYQRQLDQHRAQKMADEWDRRLAGILEVSDRGETSGRQRYAIIDGQHRWAAAGLRNPNQPLVANVHTGLTVADEAALFDKLNRQRKQTSTWDHWRARRTAGDTEVLAIEAAVAAAGLRVSEQTGADKSVWCIGTLEKIAASAGGVDLITATLRILVAAWGTQQSRSAFEAPLIHGAALVLYTFGDRLDPARLVDGLEQASPKRLRLHASTMRDNGMQGSLSKLSAVAILNQYNQTAGKRLSWPASWKGVLPKTRAAAPSATLRDPPRPSASNPVRTRAEPSSSFTTVHAKATPLGPAHIPDAAPPVCAYTDEQAEKVDQMDGRTVPEIAAALGISERTVRRIQADLGTKAS